MLDKCCQEDFGVAEATVENEVVDGLFEVLDELNTKFVGELSDLMCLQCGAIFKAKWKYSGKKYYPDNRKKYCVDCMKPCRSKNENALIKICRQCKKEFRIRWLGTYWNYNQVFCNNKCYSEDVAKRNTKIFLKKGGYIDSKGYKWLRIDGKYIQEHRYLMSKKLNRKLYKKEEVHHKNGQRADNSENNLELWNESHPSGQRVEDKLKWCQEFLNQYSNKDNICNSMLSMGT